MTIDKRNADFAYLRKNAFSAGTKGLYPARDFHQENPDELTASMNLEDIIGSEEESYDIKVIVDDNGTLRFYNLGSNSESNTAKAATGFECGAFGEDGVMILADDDHIYNVYHLNSNTIDEGALPSGATPDIAGYDGLYYWWLSGSEIYRQPKSGGLATVAFNDLGVTPRFVDFFGDQMVIFAEEAGSIVILFWDKSDTDLFDKRIVVKNARLIAGGVVDGVLTLVKGVGNSQNPKEHKGRIVVTHYDGEKFAEINAIKAGDDQTEFGTVTSVGVGSDYMIFAVDNNEDSANTDLYKNFVFKVHGDGAIEVLFEPDTAYGDVRICRVFYNFDLVAQNGDGATTPLIQINEGIDSDYADYENYTTTEYITNFLNNPYNDHKLDGFMVAFEKLFEQTDTEAVPPTGEELDVYFRVSERDDWTLLMNVTAEKVKDYVNQFRDQSVEYASDTKGLPEQRYAVSMLPDETPLPEYNEIQFKFVCKRGFSIIGAWYRYSYVTRNNFE